jgi:23S rRNA (guanosine2251-2'-O)-methyltransferase
MSESTLVYGFHPVRELLRSRPQEIVRLQVSARPGKRRQEIEELCARHRVVCEAVAGEVLDQLASAGVHNGFVATLGEAAPEPSEAADPDLWVLVEDVQDPRNLGALLRVCEGAGVAKVLIRDRGSAPLSPAVIKTSAGAAEWLPVERIVNSSRQIELLKKEGFWVYGADAAGDPPWEVELTGKVLICIGGEEDGLRQHTRESCDRLIGLPMRGQVESLNLSTAAAALLYEAVRQRTARQ